MISKKLRFLTKTAIALHLKANCIQYLILIAAIVTGDHAAAISQLKLLIIRACSEFLNLLQYLKRRNQKLMKRKESRHTQ